MSRVLFQQLVLPAPTDPIVELNPPEFAGQIKIPNVRPIAKSVEELCQFADRSVYRSISRPAVMLSACAVGVDEYIRPFTSMDPFSVGIYYAGEHTTNIYSSLRFFVDQPREQFAANYKRHIHPKEGLRKPAPIVAAHLGIYLKTMGPINTFLHTTHGCLQAIEQAEFDLATGVVKAALLGAAMCTTDTLICERIRRTLHPDTVLSEGAVMLLLEASDEKINWDALHVKSALVSYGIATPLIQFVTKAA